MLLTDALIDILTFADARSWNAISRTSRYANKACRKSTAYVLKAWKSNPHSPFPKRLHDLLGAHRLYELFVLITEESSTCHACVDERHRTLLDLAVELQLYNFAEWLVLKRFKSSTDAETMFECIRSHDLRGCSVLLSCGQPIDRFRSRDDGLNVLTCSVLYGSPELVDTFLSKGVSVPDGILIQAILARHSDAKVIDIVSLLLDKGGCDSNGRSIMGVPVLHVAIATSPFAAQLVDVLLSYGARANSRDGAEGGGSTPLDVAARKRKRICCDLLVSRGGVHSLQYGIETGDVRVVHQYLSTSPHSAGMDCTPAQLNYLLCFACAMGRTEAVKAIVSSGSIADINRVFVRDDISPLHLAACRGHSAICKFLVNHGIQVGAKAFGGMDIHIFASNITGAPIWFDPAEYGPNGSLLPPTVRLKTAAELAREAGYERISRYLDMAMVATVIARKESFDSWSSGSGTSSPNTSSSRANTPHPTRPIVVDTNARGDEGDQIVMDGLDGPTNV